MSCHERDPARKEQIGRLKQPWSKLSLVAPCSAGILTGSALFGSGLEPSSPSGAGHLAKLAIGCQWSSRAAAHKDLSQSVKEPVCF